MNLPPEDNLRNEDKSSAPKVSFIGRFHCIQLSGMAQEQRCPDNRGSTVHVLIDVLYKHISLPVLAGNFRGAKYSWLNTGPQIF